MQGSTLYTVLGLLVVVGLPLFMVIEWVYHRRRYGVAPWTCPQCGMVTTKPRCPTCGVEYTHHIPSAF